MADLKQQLKEDKAIRRAARSILAAQIEQVRQGLSGQRIGERLADKVGDPALEKLESMGVPAKVTAAVAAGTAGVLTIALAWRPISALFRLSEEKTTSEAEDDA